MSNTTDTKTIRSIVLGSLNGKLEPAFQKLATIHAKNNFSFAILTGNIFAAEVQDDVVTRLLNGDIQVPLTTYFTVGTVPLPPQVIERLEKDEDVSPCSGKRSTCCTANFNSDLRKLALPRKAQY